MVIILGWMLLAGLPFPLHALPQPPDRSASARPTASTAGQVRVWTDREDPYRRGEAARVYLSTDEPAHVAVFRVDTDGRIRVLFPREPWGDTFVRDARTFEITGGGEGRSFVVDDYPGVGYLFAVVSPDRFAFDDITRGDYWDYRVIDGGRLRGDPYLLLNALADRITRGAEYDYDLVPYYVDRHYDYPRFVCYDCHAYASYDEWDPYERACRRFRLVVYDEPRRYAYRSGQGRNVVTPGGVRGPRYVFRDADPQRDYVTRVPRSAGEGRGTARNRTSQDVGGQGTVPAPAVPSPGRRGVDRPGTELSPGRPLIEERRRQREGTSRARPQQRPETPQSTGEPELRRRRP